MESITITFQPTIQWLYRAYWLKHIACKTSRRLNFIHIFSVSGSFLLLWLVYRALYPNKPMFWSSSIEGNLLFMGLVIIIYGLWEYGRLLIAPILYYSPNDYTGLDIKIGGAFTSYTENKGVYITKSNTFTAKWQDLVEMTMDKHSVLFSFLSRSSGYHVVMIPREIFSDKQIENFKNYQPPEGTFQRLIEWYLDRVTKYQLALNTAGLLFKVILLDWVFFY